MNRNEFISMLGLGAVASVVPVNREGKLPKEKIESKNGKDYEELYRIFQERETVKIGGIEFMLTDIQIDRTAFGRTEISLGLLSTGNLTQNQPSRVWTGKKNQ